MSTTNYPVLHIDDDPATTRFVTTMLHKHGIEAAELNDPTAALDTLLANNYRVVILDIDMEGIDGLELLKKIKQMDGGIHVIMLTGLVSQSTVIRSMRYGALACLFKPVRDVRALVEVLHVAFDNTTRWFDSLKALAEMRKQTEPCAV